MAREMLINVSEGEECRIALMENGNLEEFYIERNNASSHVGNIYKGRVSNVEPSIQAAFVDFGLGRNGFLHISDLQPSYFGWSNDEPLESVGCKISRRDRPPIQRCLRRGDDIIVQIIKEGIGTKGPTLTTYQSIAGRILVMMPGMTKLGVSRKIEDEVERRRLRQILDSLNPPKECGFIIRTAGVGKTKLEIQRDLAYLTRLWQNMEKRIALPAPQELYTEGDLITRTVRDVFSTEIDGIIVDNEAVAKRIRDFVKLHSPRTKNKVEFYDGPIPLFHKYGIEKIVEGIYSRHVPLPSGGSLVIDQTEAVVAIDVNSGKFRDHNDAETTAFRTDMEAADEICRQLRLRDLGGVIICDFIDLRYERHRRELEQRLHDNFKTDRAKTRVLRMSQFGIIEITRQRMRPSVKRSIYSDCPHCHGSGLVKTPESMSLDVMRRLAIAANDQRVQRIELTVHNEVGFFLGNRKRHQIAELEVQSGKQILVRTDSQLGLDELRLAFFDVRDGAVMLPELVSAPLTALQAAMEGGKAPQRRDDRRGGRRRRDRGRGRRPEQEPVRAGDGEEEDLIEDMEDAVEDREDQQERGAEFEESRESRDAREESRTLARQGQNEPHTPDDEPAEDRELETVGDAFASNAEAIGPAPEALADDVPSDEGPVAQEEPSLIGEEMERVANEVGDAELGDAIEPPQSRESRQDEPRGGGGQQSGRREQRGRDNRGPRDQWDQRREGGRDQRDQNRRFDNRRDRGSQHDQQGQRPPQGGQRQDQRRDGQSRSQQNQPRPQGQEPRGQGIAPVGAGFQDHRQPSVDEQGGRRGRRRRGRRGRGRREGFVYSVNNVVTPPQPANPPQQSDAESEYSPGNYLSPAERERERERRRGLPSNIWIVPAQPGAADMPEAGTPVAEGSRPQPAGQAPQDQRAEPVTSARETAPSPAPAHTPVLVEPPSPVRPEPASETAAPAKPKRKATRKAPATNVGRKKKSTKSAAASGAVKSASRTRIAEAPPAKPPRKAADRHLADEESPAAESERPRSRRDLDQLPEEE